MVSRASIATIAVAMIAAGWSAGCAAKAPRDAPIVRADGVTFVLVRPDARQVSVAGSFNQWSPSSHPLSRERPSAPWVLDVPLEPGEYPFMFVIDGAEWITPPRADHYVDDGFGAKNGVVVIRRTQQ